MHVSFISATSPWTKESFLLPLVSLQSAFKMIARHWLTILMNSGHNILQILQAWGISVLPDAFIILCSIILWAYTCMYFGGIFGGLVLICLYIFNVFTKDDPSLTGVLKNEGGSEIIAEEERERERERERGREGGRGRKGGREGDSLQSHSCSI